MGCVCRKCWCNVDIFHQFYIRIEEIQGIYYKTENIIKCDITSCDSKDLIINEDSQFFENNTTEDFDNISVKNDQFNKSGKHTHFVIYSLNSMDEIESSVKDNSFYCAKFVEDDDGDDIANASYSSNDKCKRKNKEKQTTDKSIRYVQCIVIIVLILG